MLINAPARIPNPTELMATAYCLLLTAYCYPTRQRMQPPSWRTWMVSILDLWMDVNSLLHVVKGELGVVHCILGSMDVVVGILERALDTDVQYTSGSC